MLLRYLISHSASKYLKRELLWANIVTDEEIQTVHLQKTEGRWTRACKGVSSEVSGSRATLNALTI